MNRLPEWPSCIFADASGWKRYRETIEPDGMERWVDGEATLALRGRTEMIGIP